MPEVNHNGNASPASDSASPARTGHNGHPLTCGQIAKELSRNVVSVFRAIKRLRIEPEMTTAGGFKFYNVEVIEILRAEMRAPNRTLVPTNGNPPVRLGP
jgi:hypothetical protein